MTSRQSPFETTSRECAFRWQFPAAPLRAGPEVIAQPAASYAGYSKSQAHVPVDPGPLQEGAIVDRKTGEFREAELFLGLLGGGSMEPMNCSGLPLDTVRRKMNAR